MVYPRSRRTSASGDRRSRVSAETGREQSEENALVRHQRIPELRQSCEIIAIL